MNEPRSLKHVDLGTFLILVDWAEENAPWPPRHRPAAAAYLRWCPPELVEGLAKRWPCVRVQWHSAKIAEIRRRMEAQASRGRHNPRVVQRWARRLPNPECERLAFPAEPLTALIARLAVTGKGHVCPLKDPILFPDECPALTGQPVPVVRLNEPPPEPVPAQAGVLHVDPPFTRTSSYDAGTYSQTILCPVCSGTFPLADDGGIPWGTGRRQVECPHCRAYLLVD